MPVFGQILGIEGTAWNLSAALFDRDLLALVSRPYSPAQGGIHPREAAQHHASVMKELLAEVLNDPRQITGIAFSQGPGSVPAYGRLQRLHDRSHWHWISRSLGSITVSPTLRSVVLQQDAAIPLCCMRAEQTLRS